MTLQNVVQRSVLTALPNSFVQAIIILGHCQLVVVSILIVCIESNNGSTPRFTIYMAAYQGVLLLFSGPGHGCCLPQGPLQPPQVFSMLASQTSSPGCEGRSGGRHSISKYICELAVYNISLCDSWRRSRLLNTLVVA